MKYGILALAAFFSVASVFAGGVAVNAKRTIASDHKPTCGVAAEKAVSAIVALNFSQADQKAVPKVGEAKFERFYEEQSHGKPVDIYNVKAGDLDYIVEVMNTFGRLHFWTEVLASILELRSPLRSHCSPTFHCDRRSRSFCSIRKQHRSTLA
jgi:hypothetical protein